MDNNKNIISTEISNGVKITTFDDGSQQFECVEQKSFWQKIKSWWKNVKIKPYAKIRDLADPIGKRKEEPFDDGSGSKKAAEIGISIEF